MRLCLWYLFSNHTTLNPRSHSHVAPNPRLHPHVAVASSFIKPHHLRIHCATHMWQPLSSYQATPMWRSHHPATSWSSPHCPRSPHSTSSLQSCKGGKIKKEMKKIRIRSGKESNFMNIFFASSFIIPTFNCLQYTRIKCKYSGLCTLLQKTSYQTTIPSVGLRGFFSRGEERDSSLSLWSHKTNTWVWFDHEFSPCVFSSCTQL